MKPAVLVPSPSPANSRARSRLRAELYDLAWEFERRGRLRAARIAVAVARRIDQSLATRAALDPTAPVGKFALVRPTRARPTPSPRPR
ncbi:MAG: hypothetical protein Q8N18_07715 [Opitutaceae bacterium]|nr:hypothetical protein [Opitutaceae bacterium]